MLKTKKYTLDLSKKDFLTLFKMVIIADNITCGIYDKPKEDIPEYYNFTQKFLKYAHDNGFTDEVEYSAEFKMYFPTKEFEDEGEPSALIENYNEEGFWQDLIHKYFGFLYNEKYGDANGEMMLKLILNDHDLFDIVQDEILTNGLQNFRNRKIDKEAKKLVE